MIRMEGRVLEALESLRIHPRESLDDLLERLYEETQEAGGKAGLDFDRFLEHLAAGRTGLDAQREMLAST
jgi:hypothetical protein